MTEQFHAVAWMRQRRAAQRFHEVPQGARHLTAPHGVALTDLSKSTCGSAFGLFGPTGSPLP
jgi:hypothetical protein